MLLPFLSLRGNRGAIFLEVVGGSVDGSASASTTLPKDGSLREAQSNAKAGAASDIIRGRIQRSYIIWRTIPDGGFMNGQRSGRGGQYEISQTITDDIPVEPDSRFSLLVGSGTLCVVRRGSCGASSPARTRLTLPKFFLSTRE